MASIYVQFKELTGRKTQLQIIITNYTKENMAVPDFQSFFYPILKFSSDRKEHSLDEVRDFLTQHFSLTDEDKAERVPSGAQTKFDNRIYWTKSYFSYI